MTNRHGRRWTTPLGAALLIAAGVVIGSTAGSGGAAAPTPALADASATHGREVLRELNDAFVEIARQARRSVVTILTDRVVDRPEMPDPLRDFFGDEFFERFFGPQPRGQRHLRGMGSGVVVDAEGYILTNNHVVDGAQEIRVKLADGRELEARIVGTDRRTDVAVIRVDAEDLQPIRLGDSDRLRVGEWVIAVGSPLSESLAQTVTAGIVSAKGRSNVGLTDYEDFIQTDAAINPGNSGGALLNLDGELVGINSAIASRTGGFQGIGFAVPINLARAIMTQLIEKGHVTRGWLGIYIQDINETMAEGLGLEHPGGVLVSDVVEDGPAAKAGLETGDVILELDGRPVRDTASFRIAVASRGPGTRVRLKVRHDGREKTLRVELGELPDDDAEVAKSGGGAASRLGIRVRDLDARLAQRLGLDADDEGVVVTAVDPGSRAARAGLRRGDLITRVGRQRVTRVSEYRKAVSGLEKGDTVVLQVKRRNRRFFVAFELR